MVVNLDRFMIFTDRDKTLVSYDFANNDRHFLQKRK